MDLQQLKTDVFDTQEIRLPHIAERTENRVLNAIWWYTRKNADAEGQAYGKYDVCPVRDGASAGSACCELSKIEG